MSRLDTPIRSATAPGRWPRRVLALVLLATGLWATLAEAGQADEHEQAVFVVTVDGEIDLGLAPYLQRVLDEADAANASAVILAIDTPGGRLDAALQMRDALLASPLRTIAFVDRSAFSAGALLALASREIHVAPGASMGAATPVDGGTGAPADAKVISAVRATFRATAQARDRDPLIGEAMVDPAVSIDGLTETGSLLTLTGDEALRVGYADGTAADLPELVTALGLEGRPVIETSPRPAERLVRFLTNPLIGSLMMTLGILLVIGELLVGSFGLVSLLGFGLLSTFFYGHLLAGLAGWEDVVLVAVGVLLILAEILVVPGFGVPGVLGLSAVLGGGFLAMTSRDFDVVSTSQIISTASTIAITFAVVTVGLIVLLAALSRRGVGRSRITARTGTSRAGPGGARGWLRWFGDGDVLESEDDDPDAASGDPEPSDPGRGAVGVALSDLHPAGVADFDGVRVDVVTEGGYLDAGEAVEVVRAERYRRVVRRAQS